MIHRRNRPLVVKALGEDWPEVDIRISEGDDSETEEECIPAPHQDDEDEWEQQLTVVPPKQTYHCPSEEEDNFPIPNGTSMDKGCVFPAIST